MKAKYELKKVRIMNKIEIELIKTALSLLNSMVESGESHSAKSRLIISESIMIMNEKDSEVTTIAHPSKNNYKLGISAVICSFMYKGHEYPQKIKSGDGYEEIDVIIPEITGDYFLARIDTSGKFDIIETISKHEIIVLTKNCNAKYKNSR